MGYRFAEVHGLEMLISVNGGMTGKQIIVEEYDDCTITHTFLICGIVKTTATETWYRIENHKTVVDKMKAIDKQLKEQSDALTELAELIGEIGG